MSSPLTGKVAIVTGGSRGIGHAITRALVQRGAAVMISGRDSSHLTDALKRFETEYPGCRVGGLSMDVRNPDQVSGLVRETLSRFGGLDILVNNAGVGSHVQVADQSIDDWHRVLETNLSGVFFCCREAIPALRERGGGWIINISSLAGDNPSAGLAAYCASKAGVNAFTAALMQELRYDDIRVTTIMPGSVATDFGQTGGPAEWKLSPDDVARVVLGVIEHDPRSLPSRVEIRPSKPRK